MATEDDDITNWIKEAGKELKNGKRLSKEELERRRFKNMEISQTLDTIIMNKLKQLAHCPALENTASIRALDNQYWFIRYCNYGYLKGMNVTPYFQHFLEQEDIKSSAINFGKLCYTKPPKNDES